MLGTWRGAELPTGHPMDGLLAASGWWGKRFDDDESVHPLLFPTPDGAALWAMNPLLAFSGLALATSSRRCAIAATADSSSGRRPTSGYDVTQGAAAHHPLSAASTPRRWSTTSCRSTTCSAGLGDDAVLGAMDLRGFTKPYFFVLKRDDSLQTALAHHPAIARSACGSDFFDR